MGVLVDGNIPTEIEILATSRKENEEIRVTVYNSKSLEHISWTC